jgi:hypothetical protein
MTCFCQYICSRGAVFGRQGAILRSGNLTTTRPFLSLITTGMYYFVPLLVGVWMFSYWVRDYVQTSNLDTTMLEVLEGSFYYEQPKSRTGASGFIFVGLQGATLSLRVVEEKMVLPKPNRDSAIPAKVTLLSGRDYPLLVRFEASQHQFQLSPNQVQVYLAEMRTRAKLMLPFMFFLLIILPQLLIYRILKTTSSK